MEKVNMFTKTIADEKNIFYQLEYSLMIRSAESGSIYGLEVVKKDPEGNEEKERVEGFSESREESEAFLFRLAEGVVFPLELISLCDDHQTEKELCNK